MMAGKTGGRKAPRKTARTAVKKRLSQAASADLSGVRVKIDRIDSQLQHLINTRAHMAQQVGTRKRKTGTPTAEFYRPEREASVLRQVIARNKGPLSDEQMVRLFREIMSACLAQQEPLKVGYLGPEGTFTQQAVLKHFGHSVRGLPLSAIHEVFEEVESGAADFGVVPIENSTEGTVTHTADMFLLSPLKICGEIELRINQHLMARSGGLDGIERVAAHQQSLAQCRGWLKEHLPHVELVSVASNAEGARRARDEAGTAAIAGDAAAEVYGLKLLVREIEDRPDNSTRFLVIGRKILSPSGRDRTTLLVSGSGTTGPGALLKLLEPFAANGISLSRLESRPSKRKKWDYVFFLDAEGHVDDPKLARALKAVKARGSLCKVLGSYPRAVL